MDLVTGKDLPEPFTIAIHGAWGSGKTTLLKLVEKKIKAKITNGQTDERQPKIIFFDAWQYERLDIVTALLQKIENEINSKKLIFASKLTQSISSFVADAISRETFGMTLNEGKKHFKEFFNTISTMKETLQESVKGQKIIIMIDDLDRCLIENVLSMLEAIKMFLTVPGLTFMVAVDMDKIEKAWALRYGLISNGKIVNEDEGRSHAEKHSK